MGMEKLTPSQKHFVQELANLAYGRGTFDKGAVGGKGNMGLIQGTDGQTRIVKFNTHRRQEDTAQKNALTGKLTLAKGASDALREELETIADQLGMDKAKTKEMLKPTDKPLLTRKIVAQFISKIAGKESESIWSNARTLKVDLTSATDMSFKKVTDTESGDYKNTYEKYNRKVESEILANDPAAVKIVEEDDRFTMGANAPLFEKSFRLYVHDLKIFAEIEKERGKGLHDIASLLDSARKIAENRRGTEPEVHDFLRAIVESGRGNPEEFAGELLENVGFSEKTVDSDKLQPLKTPVIELLKFKENLTFDEFLGKFKTLVNKDQAAGKLFTDDELKNALVKLLLDKTPPDVLLQKQDLGAFDAEARFTYKSKSDKTYTSGNVPYRQVLKQHNCPVDNQSFPLGLSVSSLTVQGSGGEKPRTLSTVNRFGSAPRHGWGSEGYKTLAVQTFLANPTLLQNAKNGAKITVPIYRFDLAPDNNDNHRTLSDKGKVCTEVTFTDANNEKITVTLEPRVTYLQIPIDSFEGEENCKIDRENKKYEGEPTVLSYAQVKTLHETIVDLTNKAKEVELDTTSGMTTLVNQLKEYGEHLKSQYLDQEEKSITYSKTIGHEMFRVGARLALLASKLGHIPAINCNMGRDRTGAMDNEIKMLALQIEEKKDLAPIRQKDEKGDRDKYLRSELLVKNGENDLARQIRRGHPVNTDQSEGRMNFSVLFDNEYLKEN